MKISELKNLVKNLDDNQEINDIKEIYRFSQERPALVPEVDPAQVKKIAQEIIDQTLDQLCATEPGNVTRAREVYKNGEKSLFKNMSIAFFGPEIKDFFVSKLD